MSHMCKSRIKHQRVTIVMWKIWIFPQGLLKGLRVGSKRKVRIPHNPNHISSNEKFVFVENRLKALSEAIMTYCLILDTRHHLDLLKTLYVPSLSKNLISLSKLDVTGYSFNFVKGCFSLFKHNHLIDDLYVETLLTLHHNVDTECSLVNELSAFLWHKQLGHISRERMERLVKNEILPDLDFTHLNICVEVLKENKQNIQRKRLQEALNFLKLCILIYVGLLMLILLERKDTLLPLLITIHVMVMATKKVLKYLQGTKDHMLTYRRSDYLEVIGYSNLYFDECVYIKITTKSNAISYVFLLAGRAVSWKSAKQAVVVASTMKLEFVAYFKAIIQANWLLGIVNSIVKLLKMYCDNSTAIFFSKNNKYFKGGKHMELKYFVAKE
ncbi:hypothetical protein CR513_31069, partial [Mucuna pruriens]